MLVSKRILESQILGRTAHADVFELSTEEPVAVVVVFGGSGIDDDEYAERSASIIPVFDALLAEVGEINVTLVYVTAPYDVPFRKFAEHPNLATQWNGHVLTELLAPWQSKPFFVAGFSGGAALAFHGIHANRHCFGGATMGGDGMGSTFCRPGYWQANLQMFVTRNDRVSNHPQNQSIMQQLENSGHADVIYLKAGSHLLSDYANHECLGKILMQTNTLFSG